MAADFSGNVNGENILELTENSADTTFYFLLKALQGQKYFVFIYTAMAASAYAYVSSNGVNVNCIPKLAQYFYLDPGGTL